MDILPKGWVCTPLTEAIDKIVGGGTPSKAVASYYEGEIPWMTVKDMNKFRLIDTMDHISQEGVNNSSTNVIPAGTPIVATRMSLGKIVRANFDSAINQDLKAIFLNNEINDYYFEYWYRSMAPIIESIGTGTTVKGIKLTQLHALDFMLPPLPEQKRIVEKLDSLLTQVDTIQQRLNNLPDIIKRFRQSVLAAAVSGKLTEQWREENEEVFDDWSFKELGQLASDVSYGYTASSSPENVGPQMVRITDIQDGNVAWDKVPYCQIAEDKVDKYLLAENDLLFARTGATVGKSFLIKEKPPRSVYASYLIRVRCKDFNLINYLSIFFNSQHYWSQITEFSTGIGQPSVNGTKLKKLNVPLPSLAEQTEIVRLVEQYFALADTLEKNLASAKQRVDNLTQSILAKAFRGELVPQDPNDEPADKLLARIKAARLEAEKLEKAAKKAAKASKK